MAKLAKSSGILKTDLENIILLENVRFSYEELEDRASSIKTKGQLQPVIVQPSKEEPGKFNLIAGYCRYKALQLLVSQGLPFNQIEYVVRQGDPLTIQRSNLKSIEIEKALKKMITRGDDQTEIILALDKSKSWVSDILAAGKVRDKIKLDTSTITSSAIKHLRKLSEEKINKIIPDIIANGGTVAAVKLALREIEAAENPGEIIPEIKTPEKGKDNKKAVKAQNVPSGEADHFKGLLVQVDKLIDSGHNKQQIIDIINKYLEGEK